MSLAFSLSFCSPSPARGRGRNFAVFPLYSLLPPPWQSGSCGTGAVSPGTEWWGTPYKEDNSSGVGPAELSHAARSQVPPLGCWLSPLLHLKTCNFFFPLLPSRQILHEALNQPLEASGWLADKGSHCVLVKSLSLTCSSLYIHPLCQHTNSFFLHHGFPVFSKSTLDEHPVHPPTHCSCGDKSAGTELNSSNP